MNTVSPTYSTFMYRSTHFVCTLYMCCGSPFMYRDFFSWPKECRYELCYVHVREDRHVDLMDAHNLQRGMGEIALTTYYILHWAEQRCELNCIWPRKSRFHPFANVASLALCFIHFSRFISGNIRILLLAIAETPHTLNYFFFVHANAPFTLYAKPISPFDLFSTVHVRVCTTVFFVPNPEKGLIPFACAYLSVLDFLLFGPSAYCILANGG